MEQHNQMIAEIKALKGIIPICASCKKVRTNQGFWHQEEVDFRDHGSKIQSWYLPRLHRETLSPNITLID